MSTFNRALNKVRDAAVKVGERVTELGESAAAAVRAKRLEMRIDEQYENLGRIVYRDLHTEEDLEEKKLEIIAAIDAMFDELEALKADKEQTKEEACECECECTCEEACTEEACTEDACEQESAAQDAEK